MTTFAVDAALETARRIDDQKEAALRLGYQRLLAVLTCGDHLTDQDARLLSRTMKELSIDKDDVERDIEVLQEVAGVEQAVKQAEQAVEQNPPLNELQERLSAVVKDITPGIEKLLAQKRQVENQINERNSAQEYLKHERARLREIKRSRPHAFE